MLNPYQKENLKRKLSASLKTPVYNKPPVADIVSIYEDYCGGDQVDRGHYISVTCAFHDDSRPSMALYPETGTYYCFSCAAGGDGYKFIMEKEGINFKEALQIVEEKYS